MDTDPIAVALKFGFLGRALPVPVLGRRRSALRELREQPAALGRPRRPACTPSAPAAGSPATDACLVVVTGGGLTPGERIDLFGGVSIGRSGEADVRIEDRFASAVHCRVYTRGDSYFVEDLELDQRHLPQRGDAARRGRALTTSTRSGSATPSCASSSSFAEGG